MISSRIRTLTLKYPGFLVEPGLVNRRSEIDAFQRSIQRITRQREQSQPSTNGQNVICFYGPGGLGKSALSAELEARFLNGDYRGAVRRRASARMSFEDPGAVDWERTLLEIRTSLARTLKTFPAFDLAMLQFLDDRHGDRNSNGRTSRGLLTRGSRLDLPSDLSSIVSDLIGTLDTVSIGAAIGLANPAAALGSVLIRIGRLLGPLFGNHRLKRLEQRLEAECPQFQKVRDAVLHETSIASRLINVPSLMAWDIERRSEDSECHVVLFIDGWERAQELGLSLYGPTDFVSSMAAQMPNVLFVITGRAPLDWFEPKTSHLHACGPHTWTELADDNETQFGLEPLTGSQVLEYVGRFRLNDTPVIPDGVAIQLAKASEGVPLAVDFAIVEALRLRSAGLDVSADHFENPPRELLGHIIESMGEEEKRLLVVAAIAGMFDRSLLRDAGSTTDGAIDAFLSGGLTETEPVSQLPHRLHTWVRDAVTAPDSLLKVLHSPESWKSMAEDVFFSLGNRLEADLDDYPRGDEHLMARIAFLAWDIVARYGVVEDWLIDLHDALWVRGRREAFDYPKTLTFPPDSGAEALGIACGAYSHLTLDDRLTRLSNRGKAATLPPKASSYVRLQEAVLRFQHSGYGTSRRLFESIIEEKSPFTEKATNHLSLINMYSGRFDLVEQWATNFVPRRPEEEAWPFGRLARLYMYNARFDEADEQLQIKEKISDAISSPIYLARSDHLLAEILCWSDPEKGIEQADRAVRANEEVDNRYGIAYAVAARAICRARLDTAADVDTELETSRAIFEGLPSLFHSLFPIVGEAYVSALRQDFDSYDTARDALSQRASSLEVGGFWVEIVDRWQSELQSIGPSSQKATTAWLDEGALDRWAQLLPG